MSKSFTEGYLRFEFGEAWYVVKYDDSPAYRKGIEKLDTTRAVDFVGLLGRHSAYLYFIEVKDFRGHSVAERQRIRDAELAREVALKVRDSIAGIVGACQTAKGTQRLCQFVQSLANPGTNIRIVVWLEDSTPSEPVGPARRRASRNRRHNAAQILSDQLKRQIRWLTPRVIVVSRREYEDALPDVNVTSLAGAGQS